MKYSQNIKEVADLKPDYMGFIFYARSPRFVNVKELKDPIKNIDKSIAKVGVFVNHPVAELIETCRELHLDYAQLHGDESPAYVSVIKSAGIGTIKVFRIDAGFDWKQLQAYSDNADFFLFDTLTVEYGGSGKKFDWKILENYNGDKPFFLSGGIAAKNLPEIKELRLPNLWGVDINSRMETVPAMKDANRIRYFINELKK